MLCRETYPDRRGRLWAGYGGPEPIWSPNAALMDTVARLQLDGRNEGWIPVSSDTGGRASPGHPRQVTFTSTKMPKFGGVTSWKQYRQVFDAIVDQMDGTTPPLPYSCSLTWRVTR